MSSWDGLMRTVFSGGQAMEIACQTPMTVSFRSAVVLHNREKRTDFVNETDKTANLAKEAGYFAFPFAFTHPRIRLAIPNGVIEAPCPALRLATVLLERQLLPAETPYLPACAPLRPDCTPTRTQRCAGVVHYYEALAIRRGWGYQYGMIATPNAAGA